LEVLDQKVKKFLLFLKTSNVEAGAAINSLLWFLTGYRC